MNISLNRNLLGDGKIDCIGGQDERYTFTCQDGSQIQDRFRCTDGTCIPQHFVCKFRKYECMQKSIGFFSRRWNRSVLG